ncbi:MAG TPA: YfiR family protein [Bryobacteraceae bacterium]|nr:YfiR family protein [Bryobacteraceae bacterium]
MLLSAGRLFAESASEYEVKAAFLLNFTRFVEWDSIDLPPNAPLSICILGEDPFGRTLDDAVQGEQVGEHKISVQRIKPDDETTCHLVFVSRSQKDTAKLLSKFPSGVLTVGEGTEFLKHGGMIAFVLENRRVRFDISMPAVRGAGLRLSSRLLTVARSVLK